MTTSTGPTWLPQTSAANATNLGIDWMHVGLVTMLCLFLGVAAIFLLRKRMFAGVVAKLPPDRRIRILEHARLTPRDTLHLVEYDRRVVMLVSNASGVTLLDAHDCHDTEA